MVVSQLSFSTSAQVRQLTELRSQMDGLQKQLSTQRKADTYGGLGVDRTLDLSLKNQLADIGTFSQAIQLSSLRLGTLDTTSLRLEELRIEVKGATDPNNFELFANGGTSAQTSAEIGLKEFMSHMNADVGGRYLFSGRAADVQPVVDYDLMMDGNANQAGLKTVISEYNQADLGALSNGRMTTGRALGEVTIAEDGAHPFGFKINSQTSTLSNVTVTPTAGPPDSLSVDFTGQPEAGESIRLFFDLPDGSQQEISFGVDGGYGETDYQFEVGATPEDTAENFLNAVNLAFGEVASTELKAASTARASEAFFDTAPKDPIPPGFTPMARVDGGGPPSDFANATTVRDGTVDTVAWYQGDNTLTDNPRKDSTSRIDEGLNVDYGARANEDAYREIMQSMAAFVASDFSASQPNNQEFFQAMAQRSKDGLSNEGAESSGVRLNHMEFAAAQRAVASAEDRHKVASGALEGFVADVEGVQLDEVAAKLLRLKTVMEASYSATSMTFQLTLSDYIR